MRKFFLVIIAILSSELCQAQQIVNKEGKVLAYLNDSGVLVNSNYNILGYFKADGSIMDANYTLLGYLKTNGEIAGSRGEYYGRISDNLIYNGENKIIGSIGKKGSLLNKEGNQLVFLKNIDLAQGIMCVFFFFHVHEM